MLDGPRGSPFAVRSIAIRYLVLRTSGIGRIAGWFIPSSAFERKWKNRYPAIPLMPLVPKTK
jgi:hypothetical protein